MASKLAGKLMWANTCSFKHFGRAQLRPIYDQILRFDGKTSHELIQSLAWWVRVFQTEAAEVRLWNLLEGLLVHIFGDASGSPPHLRVVMLGGTSVRWSQMPVA
eukprot:4945634-Karenia_brevis.AAC.1